MKRLFIFAVCMVGSLVLTSCASSPTRSQTQAAIDKIQTVKYEVEQDDTFSVSRARNQMSPVGMMFGLIGAGIEAASRSASDSSLADTFDPALKNFNAQEVFEAKLHEYLKQPKQFISVSKAGKDAPGPPPDGLLRVEIEEWGLRPCLASQSNETMQVFAKAEGTLTLFPDKSTLWTRKESHTEQDCHALEKLRDEPGLLAGILLRTFDGLAGKMVNDVLYP
jgi:hypothetical protein